MTEEFLKLFEKKIKKAFRQESLNRRKKKITKHTILSFAT